VIHTKDHILEETHYYPFGLTMAGISSKAAAFGNPSNKNKFNGIEHNIEFDLNTYEAFYRTNDPQIGRWWQIDPKAEANLYLSPYTSMDNNPILKSDPLGDIAIIDDAVIGFFKGLFRSRINFEGGAKTRLGNAFRSAGRHGSNSANIWNGLGATDNKRSFFGQALQAFSRMTYQLPNTIVGFATAHGVNMIGNVSSVEHYAGATVLNAGGDFGGITLGSFIIGDATIEADPKNSLFQHEYGHVLQSEVYGPAYLFAIGIPSLLSANRHSYDEHMSYYSELDASTRAHDYFHRTIPGFNKWDYRYNPVKPEAVERAIEQRKRDMPRIGDAGPEDKQPIDPKEKKN
jgi:RHS repeat-associated protein